MTQEEAPEDLVVDRECVKVADLVAEAADPKAAGQTGAAVAAHAVAENVEHVF